MRFYIIEQNARSEGGHYYPYTLCIGAAAQRLGYEVVILHNRSFHGTWHIPGVTQLDPFTLGWADAEGLDAAQWGARSISKSFEAAVRHMPPRRGDHVLFHTVGYAEILDLVDHFAWTLDRHDRPICHILLRYDPWPMENNAETFRQRLKTITTSHALAETMRFYSDTEQLVEAFAALTGLPFSLVPIPFDQAMLKRKMRESEAERSGAITCTYLGDARLEKGYGLLLDAIREVRVLKHLHGKVRFVLQSNFNVPGGEPGLKETRDALATMPNVELTFQPLDEDAYYTLLAEADIVIIPYEANAYRARSSGVLVQARAAGKPIVTTAQSWMASQVGPDHAVVYDENRSLGSALLEAIASYDDLARHARDRAPAAQIEASPDHFVSTLVSATAPPLPFALCKRILVVMNGDAMVLCNGASRVALAQLRYLQLAGYKTCALFVGYNPEGIAKDISDWKRRLFEQVNRFDLERVFVTLPSRLTFQPGDRAPGPQSIEADLETHRLLDFSADLVSFVRRERINAILLNYITTLPIVDALGLADTPVICEMHDIQSLQKAIYGGRHVHNDDLECEMLLLDRCRHLISLNPHETRFVQDHLPHKPVTTRSIFFVTSPEEELAGTVPSRSGPTRVDGSRDAAIVEATDLLFVGSNHLPNIRGLQWFIEDVFVGDLDRRGTTLLVAGSVTAGGNWRTSPQIRYLGHVETVAPLYSSAKIAILPVLEGAGGPIKTMEALFYGVPMVATPTAMRGIPPDMQAGVIVVEDAAGFRNAIVNLLGGEEQRLLRAQAARKAAVELCNISEYSRAMDQILQDAVRPLR